MKKLLKRILWLVALLAIGAVVSLVAAVFYVEYSLKSGKFSGVRMDAPLTQAHDHAIESFVMSEGFGSSRFRRSQFWNDRAVTFENAVHWVRAVELVGLTSEYGDRLFPGTFPPAKETILGSSHRELSEDEQLAVQDLRSGNTFSRKIGNDPDGSFRILAPLVMRQSCSQCHSDQEARIIGAFSYTLHPAGN